MRRPHRTTVTTFDVDGNAIDTSDVPTPAQHAADALLDTLLADGARQLRTYLDLSNPTPEAIATAVRDLCELAVGVLAHRHGADNGGGC